MELICRTAAEYYAALRALLPPGRAFDWPVGGVGDQLLWALAEEFARTACNALTLIDVAFDTHRVTVTIWSLPYYQSLLEALGYTGTVGERRPLRAGFHAGDYSYGLDWVYAIVIVLDPAGQDIAALRAQLEAIKQQHTIIVIWEV